MHIRLGKCINKTKQVVLVIIDNKNQEKDK